MFILKVSMENQPQLKLNESRTNLIGAILFVAFSVMNVFELLLSILWFKIPDYFSLYLVHIFLPILLSVGIYKKKNWVVGLSFLYIGWILYNTGLFLSKISNFYLAETFYSNTAFLFLVTKTSILIGIFICLLKIRLQKSRALTEKFESQQIS